MSIAERDRNLALGYLQLLDHPDHQPFGQEYLRQAEALLLPMIDRPPFDADLQAALARISFLTDRQLVATTCQAILREPAEKISPEARATALYILASVSFEQRDLAEAEPLLEELVRVRRFAGAWYMLGHIRASRKDFPAALEAAREAVRISPMNRQARKLQATLFDLLEDKEQAREEFRFIEELFPRDKND